MKVLPKLEIGAGTKAKRNGWINADLYPGENIDVVLDATKPWPFKDDSLGAIRGSHILEHLPEPWTFFREAWRVLIKSPMAGLFLQLPYGPSEGGFGDVSHLRYYTPTAFACFQPDYEECSNNLQYRGWDAPFRVSYIYKRVDARLRWLLKPFIRHIGIRVISFLWGGYCEMMVGLTPLAHGQKPDVGTTIFSVIYKHEYEGREPKQGEAQELLYFNG